MPPIDWIATKGRDVLGVTGPDGTPENAAVQAEKALRWMEDEIAKNRQKQNILRRLGRVLRRPRPRDRPV